MHSLAAAAPSRFATVARWPARIILLFLLVLCFQGLGKPPAPAPAPAPPPSSQTSGEPSADVLLYERVIAGVRDGGRYHEVAASEHRLRNYPLRPFVTMRLPTLAWLHASLPPLGPAILLYALVAATLAAWAWQLSVGGMPLQRAGLGAMLLLAGAGTLLIPELIVWHECWAALLIALSLALRTERRFALSVLAGLAAVLIREHAILYPLVMIAFSARERRYGELSAWSGAVLLTGLYLAWHAQQVAAVTSLADAASPGWAASGGWDAALSMIEATGPLRLVPQWVAALAVPIAMVGWASWPTGNGARGTAFLCLYLVLLAAMARADNFYWAFLIAPLLPIGLLFAPRALSDLARAALAAPDARPRPASLST